MYSPSLPTPKRLQQKKFMTSTRRRLTADLRLVLAATVWLALAYVDCSTKTVGVSGSTQIMEENDTYSTSKQETLPSTIPNIITDLEVICKGSGVCVTTSAKELHTDHFLQPHVTNFSLEPAGNSSATNPRVAGKARVPFNKTARIDSGSGDAHDSRRKDQGSRKRMMSPWDIIPKIDTGTRIVGGVAAKIEDIPFIASLQFRGYHSCGASIVNRIWLLTAAHCFIDRTSREMRSDPTNYSIVAGTAYMTNVQTGACSDFEVRLALDLIAVHPEFDPMLLRPDLGMVRVVRALPMRNQIRPAKLPERELSVTDELRPGRHCYAAGWGSIYPKRPTLKGKEKEQLVYCARFGRPLLLPLLQKVDLPIISFQSCVELYEGEADVMDVDANLCTLSTDGKDACSGDSGGPVIYQDLLVGVVSWGRGCAGPTSPGVHARVDTNLDWIRQTMSTYQRGSAAGLSDVATAVLCWVLAAVPHLMSFCKCLVSDSLL